jgi:hypothetical protein
MTRLITFLLLCVTTLGYGQMRLSDKARISVITCGPWQGVLFTAFGHSAFRVNDPVNGIDYAFNYGVFDFDQPNFYLNFARGRNRYRLAIQDYKQFEASYIYYNRYLHEQVLNLTPEENQKLFDYLSWNAQPENQSYYYDYFYDNCATKLPFVMTKVFGDSVKFNGSYVTTNYSIRELTDIYLKHQPWGDLGIDLGLGLPMDKKITPYEYMFLPDYVESGFTHATISRKGSTVPLVKGSVSIYESRDEEIPKTLFHPLLVFGLVFILLSVITFFDIKRNKLSKYVDVVLFSVVGLLGILLFLLWTLTDHRAAAWNFNLLWAVPIHFVAAMAMFKNAKWLKNYFLAIAILNVLLLLTWPILPQKLHYSLIPLVMALGVRAYTQFWIRKQVPQ